MEVKSGEEHLKIPDSITYYTVCSAAVTLSYELNGGTENGTTKPVTKTVYCNAAAPQEVKGFKLQLGESIKEAFDLDGYTHSIKVNPVLSGFCSGRTTSSPYCTSILSGMFLAAVPALPSNSI